MLGYANQVSLTAVCGGFAADASALAGACSVSVGHAQRLPCTVARLIPGSLRRREGLAVPRLTGRVTRRPGAAVHRSNRDPPPAPTGDQQTPTRSRARDE